MTASINLVASAGMWAVTVASLAVGLGGFLSLEYRWRAVVRVFAFLWAAIVGGIIISIVGFIAVIWGLIDIAWEFIVGTDGLSADSAPARWVRGTYDWSADQMSYATTGKGSFEPLPSPA